MQTSLQWTALIAKRQCSRLEMVSSISTKCRLVSVLHQERSTDLFNSFLSAWSGSLPGVPGWCVLSDFRWTAAYLNCFARKALPCIKQARMKLELTIISFSRRKILLSWRHCQLTGIARKSSIFSHWKTLSNCKREKYETYCVSKFSIWRQNRVAGVRRGSWFVDCS